MNKQIIFMSSIAVTLISAAIEPKTNVVSASAKNIDPAKFIAAVYKQTGGRIARPETFKGKLVCINCQNHIGESIISDVISSFGGQVKIPIETVSGTFAWPNPKVVGNASLFIVDDISLPSIVSAPENRWAMVNIAPLRKGRGVEQTYLNARVKKEVTRGLALLTGAQNSMYPDTLMGCITDVDCLDNYSDVRLPVDVAKRLATFVKGYGIIPAVEVTYKKACEEGWAPAPTNDVQKAIWDKIHEMPTEPIKIKPETKKQEK